MTIFIILLIATSLVGSILWIRPSKREHMQMKLRLEARQKHLSVQFTHIELPDKWDKSKTKEIVTSYYKFRTKKAPSFIEEVNLYPYEIWKYQLVADGWYANINLSLSEHSKQTLMKYKEDFVALKLDADCVYLYWNEKLSESIVDDIYELLTELEQVIIK